MKAQKIAHDINTLLDVFGVDVQTSHPVLDKWLESTVELSAEKANLLENCRLIFLKQGDEWNEEELKLKFIGFLFFIANVEVDKRIQTFFERPLALEINDIALSVITDCMIATPKGKGVPKSPYFFLQEFKKQKGDKHDPEGQMFAAMLIAQQLNQDNQPVFGAWLVGNQWRFTLLDEKIYAYSRYFDASDKEDLLKIIAIIHALKDLILNR
jgi:hypothetical protein